MVRFPDLRIVALLASSQILRSAVSDQLLVLQRRIVVIQ
jgi:hypothetical protein